jgi:hypothetical protein
VPRPDPLVRLTVTAAGDELAMALAAGAARHQATLRHDEARVGAASRQLLEVLAGGGRGALGELRTAGEELYRALFPPAIRDELADLEGRPLLLDVDARFAAVPWELTYDGRAFLCRRFDLGRARAGGYELRPIGDGAPPSAFARAVDAELRPGRAVGAAVRRARDAVIAAQGEAGLEWARVVLHGDPTWVVPDAAAAPRAPARRGLARTILAWLRR